MCGYGIWSTVLLPPNDVSSKCSEFNGAFKYAAVYNPQPPSPRRCATPHPSPRSNGCRARANRLPACSTPKMALTAVCNAEPGVTPPTRVVLISVGDIIPHLWQVAVVGYQTTFFGLRWICTLTHTLDNVLAHRRPVRAYRDPPIRRPWDLRIGSAHKIRHLWDAVGNRHWYDVSSAGSRHARVSPRGTAWREHWGGGGTGQMVGLPPTPLLRTAVKALKVRESAPPVALTRALFVRALRRHTQ